MADRNTELRQLKEMLREVQQIDNLEKRLTEVNKSQSLRNNLSNAHSTYNEGTIQVRIEKEKAATKEAVMSKGIKKLNAICSIHWIISIISLVASVLITIAIFNPVAEDIYATVKTLFGSPLETSKFDYILYIILVIVIALIVAIVSDPSTTKDAKTQKESSKKK